MLGVILTVFLVLVLLLPTFITMLVYYVKDKMISTECILIGMFIFVATFVVVAIFTSLFITIYPIVNGLILGR